MNVGVLTPCHTQYTRDSSICIFLFNRTTLQVFVTYLTGALHVHRLWFYKHQHENRVRSKLFVACQHVAFSLPFAAILVTCAPSGEMHNYCIPHIIKENFQNFLIHRCNYIILSQVYCVWQVVKTPTNILNNPVLNTRRQRRNNTLMTSSVCLSVRPSVYLCNVLKWLILTNQWHGLSSPNTALSVHILRWYALNFDTCFGNYCHHQA